MLADMFSTFIVSYDIFILIVDTKRRFDIHICAHNKNISTLKVKMYADNLQLPADKP